MGFVGVDLGPASHPPARWRCAGAAPVRATCPRAHRAGRARAWACVMRAAWVRLGACACVGVRRRVGGQASERGLARARTQARGSREPTPQGGSVALYFLVDVRPFTYT